MQAIPLIVTAVGTAASMSAARRQEKDRRNILNRQLEREDEASKDSAQQVLEQGQQYTMGAREQGLEQAEQKTYAQTQADLAGAGGANVSAAADSANVSDDFLKTKAARAIDEGNRLTSIARETAKARAPGMLGQEDSLSMARLAGNLQNLWGGTKNMNRAAGLTAESVKEPGYGALGRVASSIGRGMSGGGGGSGINFGG